VRTPEAMEGDLTVQVVCSVKTIIEGVDPPLLPESIVRPGIAEVVRHVEPEMLAHLCPPTSDREDSHPGNDEIKTEASPGATALDDREDDGPVEEFGWIRCGSHPELGKGGDDVLVLEPASKRKAIHQPPEPARIQRLVRD